MRGGRTELKRRRCDLCRVRRTSSKRYGILSPRRTRTKGLYGPLQEGRLREGGRVRYPFRKQFAIRHLCEKCRPRYEAARARELPDVETYRAWVVDAPVIDDFPDRLVAEHERNWVKPGERFVELVDDDFAAEALARHSRGMGTELRVGEDDEAGFDSLERRDAEPLPGTHRDVMFTTTSFRSLGDHSLVQVNGTDYLMSDIESILWKGSMYRWHDGGVLLHWHTVVHLWTIHYFDRPYPGGPPETISSPGRRARRRRSAAGHSRRCARPRSGAARGRTR